MYKEDLALYNLHWLIWHKTKQNQIRYSVFKSTFLSFFLSLFIYLFPLIPLNVVSSISSSGLKGFQSTDAPVFYNRQHDSRNDQEFIKTPKPYPFEHYSYIDGGKIPNYLIEIG